MPSSCATFRTTVCKKVGQAGFRIVKRSEPTSTYEACTDCCARAPGRSPTRPDRLVATIAFQSLGDRGRPMGPTSLMDKPGLTASGQAAEVAKQAAALRLEKWNSSWRFRTEAMLAGSTSGMSTQPSSTSDAHEIGLPIEPAAGSAIEAITGCVEAGLEQRVKSQTASWSGSESIPGQGSGQRASRPIYMSVGDAGLAECPRLSCCSTAASHSSCHRQHHFLRELCRISGDLWPWKEATELRPNSCDRSSHALISTEHFA